MTSQNRFANMDFNDFRHFAADESLSQYERIGFPNAYREGFEPAIFADICQKLTNLHTNSRYVVDIGPGCSDLPKMLIELCGKNNHDLTLIDSAEMLRLLPNKPFIKKVAAPYPNCPETITLLQNKVDVILCYSVLHCIFIDIPLFKFLDISLSLLAPNGQMLIGDILNISKRKRFFASESGMRFHQQFMQTAEKPEVVFNQIEPDKIDDAIIFALLQHARLAGFDAYILPQNPALPMANRREDILIVRP